MKKIKKIIKKKKPERTSKFGERLRKSFNETKEKEDRIKYIDMIGSEKDQKEIDDWNRMFDERDS